MRCRELLLLLIAGCTGGPDFGGQEGSEVVDDTSADHDTDTDTDADADADADTDADSDADTDTDTDTDLPGSLAGTLRYQYGRSEAPEPPLECDLLWEMVGEPRTPSAGCPGCDFAFDVALTLDKSSVSAEACAEIAAWTAVPLAYSSTREAVVIDDGAAFDSLGAATYDGKTLTFAGGPVNEPDGGVYVTRRWSGTATVR